MINLNECFYHVFAKIMCECVMTLWLLFSLNYLSVQALLNTYEYELDTSLVQGNLTIKIFILLYEYSYKYKIFQNTWKLLMNTYKTSSKLPGSNSTTFSVWVPPP